MFMFQAETLLNELNFHSPAIVKSAKVAIDQSEQGLYFTRMAPFEFDTNGSRLSKQYSKLSIDYALMEKTDNVVVIPLDAGCNDIGTWSALYQIGKKDTNNNVIKGDVLITETTNSYINADHHMIATIGIDNLIILKFIDLGAGITVLIKRVAFK
jgi:mannose-1-phosphate guanylyltransferase